MSSPRTVCRKMAEASPLRSEPPWQWIRTGFGTSLRIASSSAARCRRHCDFVPIPVRLVVPATQVHDRAYAVALCIITDLIRCQLARAIELAGIDLVEIPADMLNAQICRTGEYRSQRDEGHEKRQTNWLGISTEHGSILRDGPAGSTYGFVSRPTSRALPRNLGRRNPFRRHILEEEVTRAAD